MVYVIVTTAVLLFLNIYSSRTSQRLFYQSKEASMVEKCLLASTEVANLEVLNTTTVTDLISQMRTMQVTRLIVTDRSGVAVYDSLTGENSAVGKYVLLPEVCQALSGLDVFSWYYRDGAMQSMAATPVMSYGVLSGCVYMLESDNTQGMLMRSLINSILSVTLSLELALLVFSITFSNAFSVRLRRIMASMRIIREGDYSHKVVMGGHDELTVLGEEFNDLTERLQSSEHKRRQFVSDASHELKTPLASIKLLSDSILQNDMDLETVREFVSDIGNEADRLNRMSQKLLSLTRSEAPAEEVEPILMGPTIQRVQRMLSPLAEKSQIRVALDLSEDVPVPVPEDDLYQIAFNLAENAIKYTAPGGIVTIRLRKMADRAFLVVADTGVGIPEDAIGHVFERFYRVDKARSRKSGGSGLGLSIVRNMVERNRGMIHVESRVGKGSTFTVEFPCVSKEAEA